MIIPVRRSGGETGSIFTLNELGMAVWGLIEPHRSSKEIAELIAQDFDVTYDQALADVEAFLSVLNEKDLIEPYLGLRPGDEHA